MDHPDVPPRRRLALCKAADERLSRSGVETEGRVDDDVMLRGYRGRCLEIVEVFVYDGMHAGAVGRGEGGSPLRAADEAGDSGVAEGGGGRIEEEGENGAADITGSAGQEDLRGCAGSHGWNFFDAEYGFEISRQLE